MAAVGSEADEQEVQLRARIAELERQLVAQAERTNRVVAEVQRRTYWLDRWQLDLDALMRRRALAAVLDTAFRVAAKLQRGLRRVRRRRRSAP